MPGKKKEKSKPDSLRKNLKSMGETALVDLVLQLAKKHKIVRDELEDFFSTSDERVLKLEAAISRFASTPANYDGYGNYNDFETEEEIQKLIEGVQKISDDPKTAMELLTRIFELDNDVMENASEYNDTAGDVFLFTATELFGKLARKIDEKKYVEDVLCRLIPHDSYGTRDDLIANIGEFLPVANIKNLISRFLDTPQKKGTYGHSSTRRLVLRLLEAIGEPSFTEETLTSFEGKETPELCFDVGKAWFKAKNYVKAQHWLEKIPDDHSSFRVERLKMLKTIQAKRKDKSGLADTAKKLLKNERTKENFETLVKAVGVKQRGVLLAEQIAEIEKHKTASYRDVEFLTSVDATDAAEEYLWRRLPKLQMGNWELSRLANLMESKKRPLIATALYRKMIEDILKAAKSKDYPTAISYMNTLAKLAPTIKDWKSVDPHKVFVEKLREQFPKRPSFWPNVEQSK